MSKAQKFGENKRSICPGCGQHFGCGAVNGAALCWCMEQPSGLFEPVAGGCCYCPECLEKQISERASRAV